VSRGRRPLPTALKKLRGNPGKRALNPSEPKPAAKAPEMPPDLPELAQTEWETIVPLLMKLNVLTEVDGKALAAYCYLYARWAQAEKEVADRGILLDEPIVNAIGIEIGSKTKANPAVGIADRTLARMKSYLVEFGLTPASRSKLRIEPEKSADPLDIYLSRKSVGDSKVVN
jgi:P27 family predicted phage terminase small subunit